jgi:hypothetical protein
MKNLLVILALIISTSIFAQTRVVEEPKQFLLLTTLEYEMVKGHVDNTTYYTRTFYAGYEYPAIQQGYYTIGLFLNKANLLTLYTELSNLETLEDGMFKLSCSDSDIGHFYAKKTGNKVIITTQYGYSKYAKFTFEEIKADLQVVKAL